MLMLRARALRFEMWLLTVEIWGVEIQVQILQTGFLQTWSLQTSLRRLNVLAT